MVALAREHAVASCVAVTPSRNRVWAARAGLAVTTVGTIGPLVGHPLGSEVANIAVVVVGFTMVLWGGRQPGALKRRTVLVLTGCLMTTAVIAPPTQSRDVWSYAMYGRMVSHYHVNPFTHTPADFARDPIAKRVGSLWRHTASVYGPVWVAISAAGTTLTGTSPLANRLYFEVLAALSVALALWIIDRETQGAPLALALLGVNPLIVISVVNGAHNDATVGLAVLAAVVLAQRQRWRWCAAVLAAAMAIKIAAGLVVLALAAWVYQSKGPRAAARLTLWAAGITGAIYVAGSGGTSLAPLRSASGQISQSSMWNVFPALSASQSGAAWISSLGVIVTLALTGFLAYRYRAKASPAVVAGLAVLAYGIAAPYVFPWYLAWGMPAVALCYRSRTTLVLLVLAALLAAGLVPDPHSPGALMGIQPGGLGAQFEADYIHRWLPILHWCLAAAVVTWALLPTRITQRLDPVPAVGRPHLQVNS